MSLDTPPLSKNSLQKKGVAYLGNNMNLALYQNLVWWDIHRIGKSSGMEGVEENRVGK